MLPRRLIGSLNSAQVLRAFSSSSALARSPSLADVTPQGAASFEAKKREFREKIAGINKKKEASQFDVIPPASSTAPDASNAGVNSPDIEAAGSQGSSIDSAASGTHEIAENGKKKGKLSSLIYGTKEGREMDQEIEQSFSQVLARGKYVHSIVFHEVKPDKVDEYVELVGKWYPKMAGMPENKVHLVGSWRTEVGDCDTFGKKRLSNSAEVKLINPSSYLGVSEISWLPRFSALHCEPPRLPSF